MANWTFWTHGSSVAVEYPDRIHSIRPMGMGVLVEQAGQAGNRDSWLNWFHFAIPTPTEIDGDSRIELRSAYLRVKLIERQTFVREMAVWAGDAQIMAGPTMEEERGEHAYYHEILLPHVRPTGDGGVPGGVVVCALVDFSPGAPVGKIHLIGAGITFYKP